MIQCDKCDNFKLLYKDRVGKKHFGCKVTGRRSEGKWKKNQCSGFKPQTSQMLLTEVLMPESDYKYTSIRIHNKINSRLEELREVAGCSMNLLCVALLDKHARVLLTDRDLSNSKDRLTLKGEIQQILQEVGR